MPTVAAGGGHILKIDFFVANLSRKRRDKGRRAKTNTNFHRYETQIFTGTQIDNFEM